MATFFSYVVQFITGTLVFAFTIVFLTLLRQRRSYSVSLLWLLGMVAVFVGERLIGAGNLRWTTGVGVALVLGAIGWRLARRASYRDDRDRAAVEGMLLGFELLSLLALALYFAQSDLLTHVVDKPLDRTAPRLAVVLAALYPALWLASALPTLLVELAYAAVARAPHLERARLRDAALSGLGLAGALVFAFSAVYIATARDKSANLSYAKTASPGESTRNIARALDQPLEISLFFPPSNEVHEQVKGYVDDLHAESPLVVVHDYDYAVDPAKAKELGVTANGTVAVARGKKTKLLSVGLELEGARTELASLDKDMQKRILQVTRPQKTVYFTVGHGERAFDPANENDKRSTVRDLRELIQDPGDLVRTLGPAEGLAADVPADAAVVLVLGPMKPFLPEELAALQRYEQRGGSLLIALDPESGLDEKELLAPLGLQFSTRELANDQVYARRTYQPLDRANLIASSFSSHASMTTLGRLAGRAPLILPTAGSLAELQPRPKDVTVNFTVHAHPQTFDDANGNFAFDPPAQGQKDGETRKAWELAAAVSWKRGDAQAAKSDKSAKKDAKASEGRAVVVADSDALSDAALRAYGNPVYAADSLHWLMYEDTIMGEVSSELDVAIAHTKKEDEAWFWLTIALAPALCLGVGYLATRRRRRRPGARRSPSVAKENAA